MPRLDGLFIKDGKVFWEDAREIASLNECLKLVEQCSQPNMIIWNPCKLAGIDGIVTLIELYPPYKAFFYIESEV